MVCLNLAFSVTGALSSRSAQVGSSSAIVCPNCLNLTFSVTGALLNPSALVGSSDGCLANPGWTNGDATTAFYFIKSLENLIHMAKVAEKSADVTTYTAMLELAKQSVRTSRFENLSFLGVKPSDCVVTCTVPSGILQ